MNMYINLQDATLVYLGRPKIFTELAGSFRPLPATSKSQNTPFLAKNSSFWSGSRRFCFLNTFTIWYGFISLQNQIYMWFFRVMSAHYWKMGCDIDFSGRTKVFPAILILQMLSFFMNSNFFQKIFGARRARAKLRALEKRASFSSVAKSGRNKNFFAEMWRIAKKKFLDWQKFL